MTLEFTGEMDGMVMFEPAKIRSLWCALPDIDDTLAQVKAEGWEPYAFQEVDGRWFISVYRRVETAE